MVERRRNALPRPTSPSGNKRAIRLPLLPGKIAQTNSSLKAEPTDEAAEVVAGGEDRVGSVLLTESEIGAAHAVLGLEMVDDGFDCGAAAPLALDLWPHVTFLG